MRIKLLFLLLFVGFCFNTFSQNWSDLIDSAEISIDREDIKKLSFFWSKLLRNSQIILRTTSCIITLVLFREEMVIIKMH